MIFAIYGPSCVGKTTVARQIAAEFGLPLRSCGAAVRDRARALGIEPHALPDAVHRQVDEETLAWALANHPCLVEGRFLNFVLAGASQHVVLIRLHASDAERERRACISGRSGVTLDELRKGDAADQVFTDRMFLLSGVGMSCVTVDSSNDTIPETAAKIAAIVSAELSRHA
jgi:cytidylate kinase